MNQYHKIKTIWAREDVKPHNMIVGKYSEPEFELLKDCEWVATEKIDGTNIRIMWDGDKVSYGGKTDRAQIPTHLIKALMELFGGEANEQKFEEVFGEVPVCLYGEGYGVKIQKGGNYHKDKVSFVLFDIKVGGWWLKREDVEDIAKKLGIDVVPIIKTGTLQELSDYTAKGFKSQWGDFICEGLVARPKVELKKRNGERVITKLKHKDFLKLNK